MMTYEKQENNYFGAWFKAGHHLSKKRAWSCSPCSSLQRVRTKEWQGKKWEREVRRKMSLLPLVARQKRQCSGAQRENKVQNLCLSWEIQRRGEAYLGENMSVQRHKVNQCQQWTLWMHQVSCWPHRPTAPCGRIVFQVMSSFLCCICHCAIQKALCQLASRHQTKWLSW